MRKIFLLSVTLSLFVVSQSQTVLNASRYFPKIDKVMEFEKALTAHIAKYHSGDWKWRVSMVTTGPDAGAYHVIEGPKHWDEFDKRGNLGVEHMNDWFKSVAIYLTDRYSNMYGVYDEELSSTALASFTDKILITHVFPKPGMNRDLAANIKRAKKAWDASGQTVAVYHSVGSGQSQYILVYRLKDGLKELEDGYRKPWKERYESAHGEGSFDFFMQGIKEHTADAWSEILETRPDLSAK